MLPVALLVNGRASSWQMRPTHLELQNRSSSKLNDAHPITVIETITTTDFLIAFILVSSSIIVPIKTHIYYLSNTD